MTKFTSTVIGGVEFPGPDFSAVTALIKPGMKVAVIGHVRPDADAIGAVLATCELVGQLGAKARGYIGQDKPFPTNLLSLPGASNIRCQLRLPDADMFIVCDCASLDRTGAFAEALSGRTGVVVIDHHTSNPRFGGLNVVDDEAEATCSLIYLWAYQAQVNITAAMAHCLYAGLITDTNCFRKGRPGMHFMAADLISCGIDTAAIASQIIDRGTIAELKMTGAVFQTVETFGTTAVIFACYQDICQVGQQAVERLVDAVRDLEGIEIGVVFKEYRPGVWSVSLRSKVVDVSLLACQFGGGGHLGSAGYTAYGAKTQVRDELLAAISKIRKG